MNWEELAHRFVDVVNDIANELKDIKSALVDLLDEGDHE